MHKLYSKFIITNSQNTKKIKTNKIKINVIKWTNIYGGSFEFDGSRKKKKNPNLVQLAAQNKITTQPAKTSPRCNSLNIHRNSLNIQLKIKANIKYKN